MAAKLLKQNLAADGRQDLRLIDQYALDMQSDRWILNGDAIVMSDTGDLLDGRKRLRACILSGKAFRTVVVEGVRNGNELTIGAHRKRGAADYLKIYGAEESPVVAKLVSAAFKFSDGRYVKRRSIRSRTSLAIYGRYKDEIDTAIETAKSIQSRLDRLDVIGLFAFLFSLVDKEAGTQFVLDAFDGQGPQLPLRDPALALRHRLRRERYEAAVRISQEEKFALIVKAWNARQEERVLSQLKWGSGANEPFPHIAGWKEDIDCSEDGSLLSEFGSDDAAGDLEIAFELITPEKASEYLALNLENNRNRVKTTIEQYARDMSTGKWQINGQAVKFDQCGRLFDGQHRMEACIQSERPFWTLVVRNVANEAFATYDDRATKGFGAALESRGVKYPTGVAALVDRLLRWDSGRYTTSYQPTLIELEEYLNDHPEIFGLIQSEVISAARNSGRSDTEGVRIVQPRSAALAYALFSRIDQGLADEIMSKLFSGDIDTSKERVLLQARNYLINLRNNKKAPLSGSMGEKIEVACLIKTWNHWIQGSEPKTARAFALADTEAFPMPKRL